MGHRDRSRRRRGGRAAVSGQGAFEGRGVLVTGGARGIGRAIALAFAREGADVAFSFRADSPEASTTAAEIEGMGRRVFARKSDAGDPEETARLVEGAKADLGRLDVVVANAGWAPPDGWEDVRRDVWHRVFDVNVLGLYDTIRHAAPELRRRRGSAVAVASISAFSSYPEEIAYAASKAAVVSVTRSLALALAPEVRVNAVAPGWVRTRMAEEVHTDPRLSASIVRRIPQGRWGEPEDIAPAALFLASDGARFVTGETLVVDGGNLLYWRAGAEA